MEEKIIIQSSKKKVRVTKETAKKLLIRGLAMFGGGLAVVAIYDLDILDAIFLNGRIRGIVTEIIGGLTVTLMGLGGIFTILGAVAYVLNVVMSSDERKLTVTPTHIYGRATWGRKVDLPVDSITAIGVGHCDSIVVTTPSGIIRFLWIENRYEILNQINKLLTARQNKPQVAVQQKIPQSSADELKKFKELLDSGAITQEEYDAKKKQLLGL